MSRRLLLDTLIYAWTLLPWTGLAWLSDVIACRRWSGWVLLTSLMLSTTTAFHGWRLVWRWSERQYDLAGARLLQRIPEPEPWELWKHPVHAFKAAHLAHCRGRWGVNARSSGWAHMERAAWLDLAGVPVCLLLAIHPWWFNL